MVCLPSTTQAATFSWAKNISADLHCNDSTNALSLATYVNAYPLSVLSFSNTVWTFQLFFEMTATYSLNQTTGSPSSLKESCLWAVLCYKRLLTKACMGCKRFFLKERKNVMFLNKMYLPYCLVVFFVVCPRLRPFWSVFGELALFWSSTVTPRSY